MSCVSREIFLPTLGVVACDASVHGAEIGPGRGCSPSCDVGRRLVGHLKCEYGRLDFGSAHCVPDSADTEVAWIHIAHLLFDAEPSTKAVEAAIETRTQALPEDVRVLGGTDVAQYNITAGARRLSHRPYHYQLPGFVVFVLIVERGLYGLTGSNMSAGDEISTALLEAKVLWARRLAMEVERLPGCLDPPVPHPAGRWACSGPQHRAECDFVAIDPTRMACWGSATCTAVRLEPIGGTSRFESVWTVVQRGGCTWAYIVETVAISGTWVIAPILCLLCYALNRKRFRGHVNVMLDSKASLGYSVERSHRMLFDFLGSCCGLRKKRGKDRIVWDIGVKKEKKEKPVTVAKLDMDLASEKSDESVKPVVQRQLDDRVFPVWVWDPKTRGPAYGEFPKLDPSKPHSNEPMGDAEALTCIDDDEQVEYWSRGNLMWVQANWLIKQETQLLSPELGLELATRRYAKLYNGQLQQIADPAKIRRPLAPNESIEVQVSGQDMKAIKDRRESNIPLEDKKGEKADEKEENGKDAKDGKGARNVTIAHEDENGGNGAIEAAPNKASPKRAKASTAVGKEWVPAIALPGKSIRAGKAAGLGDLTNRLTAEEENEAGRGALGLQRVRRVGEHACRNWESTKIRRRYEKGEMVLVWWDGKWRIAAVQSTAGRSAEQAKDNKMLREIRVQINERWLPSIAIRRIFKQARQPSIMSPAIARKAPPPLLHIVGIKCNGKHARVGVALKGRDETRKDADTTVKHSLDGGTFIDAVQAKIDWVPLEITEHATIDVFFHEHHLLEDGMVAKVVNGVGRAFGAGWAEVDKGELKVYDNIMAEVSMHPEDEDCWIPRWRPLPEQTSPPHNATVYAYVALPENTFLARPRDIDATRLDGYIVSYMAAKPEEWAERRELLKLLHSQEVQEEIAQEAAAHKEEGAVIARAMTDTVVVEVAPGQAPPAGRGAADGGAGAGNAPVALEYVDADMEAPDSPVTPAIPLAPPVPKKKAHGFGGVAYAQTAAQEHGIRDFTVAAAPDPTDEAARPPKKMPTAAPAAEAAPSSRVTAIKESLSVQRGGKEKAK
jgi:hypothetical protein